MSEPLEPNFQPPPPPPTAPAAEPPAPRPIKLRPVAIGVFALGLIVLVGGIAKFIAGGIGTGAALAFWGIALFGLSFVPLPRVQDEPPMSDVQKLLSIFYEPTRVFRNLRSHPRWAAAFIAIVILSVIYTFTFTRRITPERIVNHTIDKLAELGPPFAPPAEQLEGMRAQQLEDAKNPVMRVGQAVKTLVGAFAFTCALAALYMLAVLAFGGRINFWQSLAVSFWSALPVVAIQKIVSLVLLFIKAPEDLHPVLGQESLIQDNLGILFSPSEHPVLFVIGSFIGILSFYGLWLRAKGLHQGGTKVPSSTAWGAAITLWVLGLILVSAVTALFPTFIS